MATFGKGVEYALHCMAYLIDPPGGAVLTVSDIAQFQGVSETYLAKIFTKLTKAGLVRSSIGAKGGYELARAADQISFWDVVVAVEGGVNLFQCRNIRAGCALYRDKKEKPDWLILGTCEIHKVMLEAEARVQATLQEKNLAWLSGKVSKKIPKEEMKKFTQWFVDINQNKP
jgi:Rrf2 family protein